MRIVLDTNVLVSALMNPHGPPGAVLQLIVSGMIVPLYDDRIIAEYRNVLARPKLRISPGAAESIVDFIELEGVLSTPALLAADVPDRGDLPFIEVALSSHPDALVTGNTRHFIGTPLDASVPILTPTEFLALWRSRQHDG